MPGVTSLEEMADETQRSPSSRSASASASSLSRWRAQQQQQAHDNTDATPHALKSALDKSQDGETRRSHRPPQVVFTDAPDSHEKPAPPQAATASSPVRSISVEECSYRNLVSDRVMRSASDPALRSNTAGGHPPAGADGSGASAPVTPPAVRGRSGIVGDEPVRWSFASASLTSRDVTTSAEKPSSAVSPTAIAAAVPVIAQELASATDAFAGRWADELQHSTTQEAEWMRAYREMEQRLRETQRTLAAAEARQQKEVESLTAQLTREKAGRVKAEQDREELLSMATISPGVTPRMSMTKSVETGGGEGGMRMSQSTHVSTTSHLSEAFYEKMKEREERARARVRKEFVRQAQENLYAEQRKTTEAEKTAALATRRLQRAEEELKKAQDALQDATAEMEAKDVQLHERAIHIQELEAQLRLLQRQLESAEEAKAQDTETTRRRIEELQQLCDRRQAELEALRGFAQQLHEELGIKTRDLFDHENSRESVLQQVHALQSRCRTLESNLETAVTEATSLLSQKRQQAEAEAKLLQERNAELRRRCADAEAELGELKGRREYDAREVSNMREYYEKALSDVKVEARSLQLQLERVLDAAKHSSTQSASERDRQRQQQEALVRQYAAESTAAREELDRARAVLQRENEKNLRTILELSQQLTVLKDKNTRLEHLANVREHESADAARLLARTQQELQQLRDERRQLSMSLIDVREESRMRSVLESQDALQRRVAELENVRRDLNTKLLQAHEVIDDLQYQQQSYYYASEPGSRLSQGGSRAAVMGVGPTTETHMLAGKREQQQQQQQEERRQNRHGVTEGGVGGPQRAQQAPRASDSAPAGGSHSPSEQAESEARHHHHHHHHRRHHSSGSHRSSQQAPEPHSTQTTMRESSRGAAATPSATLAPPPPLSYALDTQPSQPSTRTEQHRHRDPQPRIESIDQSMTTLSKADTDARSPSVQLDRQRRNERGAAARDGRHSNGGGGGAVDGGEGRELSHMSTPPSRSLAGKGSSKDGAVVAATTNTTSTAAVVDQKLSGSPYQRRTSPLREDQQLQYTEDLKSNLPSPQGRLARPRRSTQPSLPSVAASDQNDGARVLFSHTSDALPVATLPERRVVATRSSSSGNSKSAARKKEEEGKRGGDRRRDDDSDGICRIPQLQESNWDRETSASHGHGKSVVAAGKPERSWMGDPIKMTTRDELESDPCWDSTELDAPHSPQPSASEPAVSHHLHKSRAKEQIASSSAANAAKHPETQKQSNSLPSRQRRSVATMADAFVVPLMVNGGVHGFLPDSSSMSEKQPQQVPIKSAGLVDVVEVLDESTYGDAGEGDGILRYSRIPVEVVSPVSKLMPRSASATPHTSFQDEAQNLFSNVHYVSTGPSATQAARDEERQGVAVALTQHRQHDGLPVSAGAVDRHQSTPPPERRRGKLT